MNLKMKKAWSLGIAVLLMMSFVFTGCDKQSGNNAAETASPETSATADAEEQKSRRRQMNRKILRQMITAAGILLI